MIELWEYVPVNLFCVIVLGALGLRRLVRMDGHHWTRVVLLTVILWVPAIYLFLLSWGLLFPSYPHPCVVTTSEEPRVFCISEY
jgi:hypothetical protein